MEPHVKILRWAALVFLALALVCILFLSRAHWEEQADFDILGIAWMLGNAPNLMLGMVAFFFVMMGLYALLRSFGLRG